MAVASPGLRGIVAAETRKSTVDGARGIFNLCGYDINDIAGKVSFEEAIFLLWNERLPGRAELAEFERGLRTNRRLPDEVVETITRCPKDAHPMSVVRTAVSMLGVAERAGNAHTEPIETVQQSALSIVAKMGSIVAAYHRHRNGQELLPPREDLSEAAHFLYQLTGEEPGEVAVRALDMAFVLHIDHGFNNSAFTARVVISSMTDIFSAVTAAVGALKGPLHGGANEGVIPMLKEIGSVENVDAWVDNALAKKQVVMGIGHPVYKTVDPRTKHLKEIALELTEEVAEGKWISIAERIEQRMFEAKKLHGNIDLYAAPVYYSLGIPIDLFTPVFVIARSPGWCAHILEQVASNRIFRPESDYVGPPIGRQVEPIDQR